MEMNNQKGFSVLFLSVLTTAVALTIGAAVFMAAFSSIKISRNSVKSAEAVAASEAGLEDATRRIKYALPYSSSYSFPVGSTSASVIVAADENTRTVESQGMTQSHAIKTQAVLSLSTSNTSFFYGVHVGDIGLTMGNGSTVAGNVFSNGKIVGSGTTQSTITGTAKAAGSGRIEDIKVNGDAYGNKLEDCIVDGAAFYHKQIINCPAGSVQTLAQQIEPQNFPITQTQIDLWKQQAEAGGTVAGYSIENSSNVTLGPKKINGSLSMGNSVTLTLGGTVWATGSISTGNNVIIQLDPSYGSSSGVLILDGPMSFGNGVILRGSGQASSKLMVLSLYDGTAFSLGNTGNGDIFYAPNGTVDVGNGFVTEEVTAKGLLVGNNATITYESGLANSNFSSGPGATFEVTSWKEIE